MARQPVTRMQLDAYRFSQRRLESALARRDPVLLHEEIRGQRRVVIAGVVLSVLVLAGFFGFAKIVGKPAWERHDVVAGKQSGRMFVVIHNPDRLVPVENLAAARLVLAAAAKKGAGGRGGAGGSATVTTMDDAALDKAPRTAAAAVRGAAANLPSGGDPPPPTGPWAVCDTTAPRPATVLVAGATEPKPMPDTGGLLLETGGKQYLVTANRRHRIDDPAVLRAYDLLDTLPRKASDDLLNAIPEGRALDMPEIPRDGATGPQGMSSQVGDVVQVRDGSAEQFYLVLATGVLEISKPLANLVRTGPRFEPGQSPPTMRTEQVNAVPRVTMSGLAEYPSTMPNVPRDRDAVAVCWQWNANGKGGVVTVDKAPPIRADRTLTRLAQADDGGAKLDEVSVPAGTALVARGVSGRQGVGGGLWLVSETGVAYQVAAGQNNNNETAAALGIQPETAGAAPEQALRMLPNGGVLDLQDATRTADVLITTPDGG